LQYRQVEAEAQIWHSGSTLTQAALAAAVRRMVTTLVVSFTIVFPAATVAASAVPFEYEHVS